jgi:large subunit ribosomal protein L23
MGRAGYQTFFTGKWHIQAPADKNDIRRAVEILFKVKVDRVNTMNVSGRLRRKRTRHEGRTPRWKKAIVTLKSGDQITLT